MEVNIICIGKLKESYWRDAAAEYIKRLRPYCRPLITELKESRLKANAGPAEEKEVIDSEGKEILARITSDDYVISLEIKGKRKTSEDLARAIDSISKSGKSRIDFLIGGSLGLSEEVSRRADLKLSFSDMTFPHQMMRVVLLEQIYRSYKIIHNEPYHK